MLWKNPPSTEHNQTQPSLAISSSIHTLSYPSLTWGEVIQQSLLNFTLLFINVSHCLPSVVPSSSQSPLASDTSVTNFPSPTSGCLSPSKIQFWKPETGSHRLSTQITKMCCQPFISLFNKHLPDHSCYQDVSISKPTCAPHRSLILHNENLSIYIFSSSTVPCFLVAIIPQLTLYSQSEFYRILPRTHFPELPFCLWWV